MGVDASTLILVQAQSIFQRASKLHSGQSFVRGFELGHCFAQCPIMPHQKQGLRVRFLFVLGN